ncbi:MAG: lipoyl(octanoyl) transferase LipB [Alphaproteobacteria bacterium]|nr:lipoyl(octanoyl) transferase LipB [Alphaproteobacteria bacterium]MBV8548399.1 lipoyl(octanoyl) transferase LipB [Alphaproteobacteria bacterium]
MLGALCPTEADTINRQPEWRVETKPVSYPDAVTAMETRVSCIENGTAPELFWLLEHPPLYTAGTSAKPADLVDPDGLPVFETGRGGQYTYHGPGQRVLYALNDLRTCGRDVRAHVWRLEEWVIRTMQQFGIIAERREGRVGLWVVTSGREEKIAAIGVRVRHWVTFHGLALNVTPDLNHFKGIVPCGLPQYGVTSMAALGVNASMAEIDAAFYRTGQGLMWDAAAR